MYKKADISLYDQQYQKQLMPRNPTYQQNVKKQPQPATSKNNTNNQSATPTNTVKNNIVPSSTGFSNFEQRLASVRGKGYSNWDFGGSYGDTTYSTIKDYDPNSDPTAVASNKKTGEQALQYMQWQEKQRQLSAQKNKVYNENRPVANNTDNTDNATVPIATIQKNKNNKWDREYFSRLNSRIQQLQNRLKVPTPLNERAYLEAHLRALQSQLSKWTTDNYTNSSYTIPSMQQTPTVSKQQALLKQSANRPLSTAYSNAKANFDAYSQRRQAEFNRQKFNPDGSWKSVNRVTPRLAPTASKKPLFQKNRKYTINDIRNVYKSRGWNVFDSQDAYNADPNKAGIYVANDGLIHVRQNKNGRARSVARTAKSFLGDRFVPTQQKPMPTATSAPSSKQFADINSRNKYNPSLKYTPEQQKAMLTNLGYNQLDTAARNSVKSTGYYTDSNGNIRVQVGDTNQFRDVRASTFLQQQQKRLQGQQQAVKRMEGEEEAELYRNQTQQRMKEDIEDAEAYYKPQTKNQIPVTPASAASPVAPAAPARVATTPTITASASDSSIEQKPSWWQRNIATPIGESWKSIQNGPVGWAYDNTLGKTRWGSQLGRDLDAAITYATDPVHRGMMDRGFEAKNNYRRELRQKLKNSSKFTDDEKSWLMNFFKDDEKPLYMRFFDQFQ